MKNIIVIVGLIFLNFSSYSQSSRQAFAHWSFDGKDPLADQSGRFFIKNLNKDCPLVFEPGKIGKAAISGWPNSCWFEMKALADQVKDKFSLSFYFKGDGFIFSTYPARTLEASLKYPNLLFKTTLLNKGKEITDNWIIPLTGSGIHSYDYLADGNWHQMLFTVDARTGKKEIHIDGNTSADYTRQISTGEALVVQRSEGFTQFKELDEIRLFNVIASPPAANKQLHQKATVDNREFAPGFPKYDQTLYEQLRHFPAPRYLAGTASERLFSWLDINYLHRELVPPATKGFGKINPDHAVQLAKLMADKWNYYVELPLLYQDSAKALSTYRNNKTVAGALANFAANHPSYPVSTITYQTMVRKTGTSLLKPSLLPALSAKDGRTTGYYLKQLKTAIGREPAIINENGEIFGHFLRSEQLKKDQQEYRSFIQSGLTEAAYSGSIQFKMDSAYKANALQHAGVKTAYFSFYNLSAIQPAYWPDYGMRRKLNQNPNGKIYPTPDFYPRKPIHWLKGAGAINGFAILAEGRKTEIGLGDQFFSPFISAGWGDETENIRPAQWLALLKAMVMLGADFFYVGYFNVTGKGGKWRDGFGPNDPRGYAYQVAMPAYAQAIGSLVPEFFTKGILLNPQKPGNAAGIPFCFEGTAANDLILVRKLENQFLIYGSIQPNSNEKGNAPLERNTSFMLENRKIELKIKRQGVLYLLDLSQESPVIRQLDSWHQFEHPSFWSATIKEEAVNYSHSSGAPKRITKRPAPPTSFVSFQSVVQMKQQDLISFQHLRMEPGRFSIELEYEQADPGSTTELQIKLGTISKTLALPAGSKIRLPELFPVEKTGAFLSISVVKGTVNLIAVALKKQ